MWEAIRDNRRRSTFLIILMGVVLVLLGATIGWVFMPDQPPVGLGIGAAVALALWGIQLAVAFSNGDRVVLATSKARRIHKSDAPQLYNVVEEMTIASGLGTPPAIYLIDDEAPNAFATGLKPEKSAVAITTGALRRLNRDELQGVMAHEIGHVVNHDIRFMTIAMVMVGTIVLLSDILLRSMFYGAGRRSASRKSGGNAAIIVAIVAAIVAPIFAQLLYFACSRKREYLADASAARFTRYPEGLASALEKISTGMNRKSEVSKAVAPLYIVNPLQAGYAFSLFSTHPPVKQRVSILRAMHGAGYGDYMRAYAGVTGTKEALIAGGQVQQHNHLDAREAAAAREQERTDRLGRAREALDTLDRGAGLLLLSCACGVRIKVPQEYKKKSVECPRCGSDNALPEAAVVGEILDTALARAQEGTAAKTAPAPDLPPGSMQHTRQGTGWESFKCRCGATVNLSPMFNASHAVCGRCKEKIAIV